MLEKYKYTDTEMKELLNSIVILVDTREKENKHCLDYFDKHKIKYEKRGLNFADYSFYLPKNEKLGIIGDIYFEKEILIERKANANELSGNLTQGRERFEEELTNVSKAKKKYLLIENCTYDDIVTGNYTTQYNKKSYLASIHSFNHKFGIEIVFMPKREYTPIFILGTFQYYLRNILK